MSLFCRCVNIASSIYLLTLELLLIQPVTIAKMIPHGRILSLAEGEGRNAVYLASLGYEVTGVDGSEIGLRKTISLLLFKDLSRG